MMRASIVIPTRNRPKDIRNLLANLSDQSVMPDQVIIVDSSDTSTLGLKDEFPALDISYYVFKGPPSAAAQRNYGIDKIREKTDLIGFVDDDIIFEDRALENMLEFWQKKPINTCGAAFNLLESNPVRLSQRLGLLRVMDWIGLYRQAIGRVAPSGWHSRNVQVEEDTQVEWLSTSAVFFLPNVLYKNKLDPFFKGYSYLEDLDFSYGLSRKCDLAIVANAKFRHLHHHNSLTAKWYASFGRMEVRNRLYFVRKYNLSIWRCYLALIIRSAMTLIEMVKAGNISLLSRVKGNVNGLLESLFLGGGGEK